MSQRTGLLRAIGAGAIAIVCLAGNPASAQVYNAYKQFRLKANPNGDWSYLAAGELLTQKIKTCANVAKFECWWNGGSFPNSAIIGANKSGMTVDFDTIVLPADYLDLDPENLSDVTLQWTAVAAGTVLVHGNFLGVDTNEASHNLAILHNGTAVKSFTISAYQQEEKFHLMIPVAPGDTISFASYTNGATYLSTGLQATITPQ